MRDAADMPELEKDDAALGVHGVDHLAPARDLRLRIDAGRRWITAAVREHGRGLGDEQAALGGALTVIFGVERPRRKALALGPHARQRRHRDPMRELVRTDLQRLKQRLEFHAGPKMVDERTGIIRERRAARKLHGGMAGQPKEAANKKAPGPDPGLSSIQIAGQYFATTAPGPNL